MLQVGNCGWPIGGPPRRRTVALFIVQGVAVNFPAWQSNIAMEAMALIEIDGLPGWKITIFNGKIHYKW